MMRTTRTRKVNGVSTVFTRCPDCGKLLRVAVDYPKKNKGFETTDYTCGFCGCEIVEDCHKYDKKGNIIA